MSRPFKRLPTPAAFRAGRQVERAILVERARTANRGAKIFFAADF
jgi:hypothetical protein